MTLRAVFLIGLSAPAQAFAQEAPPDALAADLRAAGLCDEAFLEYARLDATLRAGERWGIGGAARKSAPRRGRRWRRTWGPHERPRLGDLAERRRAAALCLNAERAYE